MNRIVLLLIVAGLGMSGYSLYLNKSTLSNNKKTLPPDEIVMIQGSEKDVPTINSKIPHVKKVRTMTLPSGRVVFVLGEIGGNAVLASQEIKLLNQESEDPIYVVIDSPGGSVVDGNMLVSAIETSKAPVYTICHRMCASMGAVIHQYGKKRMMVDRSILMFHPASAGTQGTVEQMKSFSDFLNNYINKTERYIAKRAKIDYETYKNRIQKEVWIDAEDSTLEGFNDEIVSINFESTRSSFKLKQVKKGKNVIEEIKWKK